MTFWTKWTRNRAGVLDEFADTVRSELSEMPVPTADERLLERILESRRRGLHVMLPVEDRARRRRSVYWVGAIAAAAAAVFAVNLLTRDRGAASEGAFEGWFATESAYAQGSAASPTYPGARVTHAERMRPLRLTYTRSVRGSGAVTKLDIALSAVRDIVDGVPAWRVVLSSRGPGVAMQLDSTWVSAATFAPLRRTVVEAPYRSYERIVVRQAFTALRLRGEMNAFKDGAVSARRRFDRALPPGFTPYVAEAFAPIYHAGVAMDRRWKGSVSLLGWAVRDNDAFTSIAMRVDGEETVRVPAGEFPCWRIAIDFADGHRHWYWVRKRDGLGIRTLDSTDASARGVREIALNSEQTP